MKTQRLGVLSATVLVAVILTGCGSTSASGSKTLASHSATSTTSLADGSHIRPSTDSSDDGDGDGASSPPDSATDAQSDTGTSDATPNGDAASNPAPGVGLDSGASLQALEGKSFAVKLSGSVSSRSFERDATLRILPTISSNGSNNDVNVVDVCLISGFPGGQPDVGAIWYSSNSGCDPGANAAHLDLAYVKADGSSISVEPDKRIAATQGNNFTTSSNFIYACTYAPVGGALNVTVDGSTVSGTLELDGYGGANCGQTHYSATLRGSQI